MPKHKISKKLQEEYAAGKTQVELAQMYNVSQATINKLLTKSFYLEYYLEILQKVDFYFNNVCV